MVQNISPKPPARSDPDESHATLCHELLTPLTVLRGRTQLLQRRLQRPGLVAERELPMVLAQLEAMDGAILRLVATIDAMGESPSHEAARSPG